MSIPSTNGTITFAYHTPVPMHGTNMQVLDVDAGDTPGGGMTTATFPANQPVMQWQELSDQPITILPENGALEAGLLQGSSVFQLEAGATYAPVAFQWWAQYGTTSGEVFDLPVSVTQNGPRFLESGKLYPQRVQLVVGGTAPADFSWGVLHTWLQFLPVQNVQVIPSVSNILSPAATTFSSTSSTNSFTVTTGSSSDWPVPSIVPIPALSINVATPLPTGVTFTDNGNGTGVIAGDMPASGTFDFDIDAENSVNSCQQPFTLTVD